MKYKMVVSDFDWTLGNSPDFIEESTVKTIREYEKKGGIFTVCTGRLYSSVATILRKHGFQGYVIACLGAIIADIDTGERIYSDGIKTPLAAKAVRALRADGHTVLLDYDDRLCYTESTPYTDAYERLAGISGYVRQDLAAFIEEGNVTVQKIMVMCEERDLQGILEKYGKLFAGKLLVNSGSKNLVEIVSADCSKGISTRHLAERYGVRPEEVLAVGDSTNDLSLTEQGFHSVAVGDGSEKLRAAADEVTVPYAEKPVETLLKKYCLSADSSLEQSR